MFFENDTLGDRGPITNIPASYSSGSNIDDWLAWTSDPYFYPYTPPVDPPFDLEKWAKENKTYLMAGGLVLVLLMTRK